MQMQMHEVILQGFQTHSSLRWDVSFPFEPYASQTLSQAPNVDLIENSL
jgi:hypothetical protein